MINLVIAFALVGMAVLIDYEAEVVPWVRRL
jgi:hypothetical protein